MIGGGPSMMAVAATAERRGFVLGQTLAELMLLILFVILLTIGTAWLRDRQELQALADAIGANSSEGAGDAVMVAYRRFREESQRLARELAESEAARRRAEADLDRFREITTDQGRLTPERARALAARVRDAEAARKDLERFKDIATEDGPLTPERAKELAAASRDAKAILALAGERGDASRLAEQVRSLGEVRKAIDAAGGLEKIAQASNEVDRLKGTVASLQRQLQSGGRGLVFPSCLVDPANGDTLFLFDIALRSGGIEVREVDFPGRSARLATLPKSTVDTGQPLSDKSFLDGTRMLYQWSVERECRFYVNIYDATASSEKAIYKQRLDIVERHFYKRLARGGF